MESKAIETDTHGLCGVLSWYSRLGRTVNVCKYIRATRRGGRRTQKARKTYPANAGHLASRRFQTWALSSLPTFHHLFTMTQPSMYLVRVVELHHGSHQNSWDLKRRWMSCFHVLVDTPIASFSHWLRRKAIEARRSQIMKCNVPIFPPLRYSISFLK